MSAFCILAAGKGTRINSLTKLHKALLPINNKAVISHIIDKAPDNCEIVIALGHQKELIREYCLAAHPNRKFNFVFVDNYEKSGSGPGYSLSKCKEFLNQPFYLFCADCLVEEPLPDLSTNWMGVYPITDPENWSTAEIIDGNIINFKNKSREGYPQAWIGVAGIKHHKIFWEQIGPSEDKEFEMVSAFYNPKIYPELKAFEFTWHDTGTPQNYEKTKKALSQIMPLGMSKQINEITYKCEDRCVKVFGDSKICTDRIKRAKVLEEVLPKMVFSGENVYAYEWIEGNTLYEKSNVENLEKLLDWCSIKIWGKIPVEIKVMENLTNDFYLQKTKNRLTQYLEKKGKKFDSPNVVNGRYCQPMEYYINQIPWETIKQSAIPVKFHGDFQPENIIVKDDGNFALIDWRDSFANEINFGDLYYDFAKLNGGLSMSYNNVKLDKFQIHMHKDGSVEYDFEVPEEINKMGEFYTNWLLKERYNLYKVKIMTALIYLNMAPLHVLPFDNLLFYHSKYLLSTLLS